MAGCTSIFNECLVSFDFILIECVPVSLDIEVETAIRGYQCFLILGNSLGNTALGKAFSREKLFEFLHESSIFAKSCNDVIPSLVAHLNRVYRRAGSLFLQISGTSVPELLDIEYCIINRRSINSSMKSVDTLGSPLILMVGTAVFNDVA